MIRYSVLYLTVFCGFPIQDLSVSQNGTTTEFAAPQSSPNFGTREGVKVEAQRRPLSGDSEVSGAVANSTGFSNGGHGFIRLEDMEAEDGVKKRVL